VSTSSGAVGGGTGMVYTYVLRLSLATNVPGLWDVSDLASRCNELYGGILMVKRVSPAYTQREVKLKENDINKDLIFEQIMFICMIFELVMFVCMILLWRLYLCKLTRLFWPNTCLVSMCITGASGAANKQV